MKTKKFCSLFANQMIEIRASEQTNSSVSGFGLIYFFIFLISQNLICKPIISSEQNFMDGGSAGNHTIIGVLCSNVEGGGGLADWGPKSNSAKKLSFFLVRLKVI
jgi:hypothetical protein